MSAIERSGVRIQYEVEGSGPPLVLLHGAFASSEMWRFTKYVEELAPDFRVVLVDLRGHGQSSRPHDAAAYAIAEQVDDVVAVLDELGLAAPLFCGFSQGAIVAVGLAARYPDRASGLVAVGLPPTNLGFEDVPREPADVHWIERLEREGMAPMVAIAEAAGSRHWARLLGQADPAAMAALLREDDLEPPAAGLRIRELELPMTCVWGAGEGERRPPLPPHAEVVVIPGADHMGTIHHREVVVPLIRAMAGRLVIPVGA